MFITFLRNVGSYKKDQKIDLPKSLAQVLIYRRHAVATTSNAMLSSPSNAMIANSPISKNMQPKKRGRPKKQQNETVI